VARPGDLDGVGASPAEVREHRRGVVLTEHDDIATGDRRDVAELSDELHTLTGRPHIGMGGTLIGDIEYRDGYYFVHRAGAEPMRLKVLFGDLPPGIVAMSDPARYTHLGVPVDVVVMSNRLGDRLAVGEAFHRQAGALAARLEPLRAPRDLRPGDPSGSELGRLQGRWFLATGWRIPRNRWWTQPGLGVSPWRPSWGSQPRIRADRGGGAPSSATSGAGRSRRWIPSCRPPAPGGPT
jgi:hypothetical protein